MHARLSALVLCAALLTGSSASGCRAEPRVMQVEIAVSGMTCESCVEAITHEVGRLEGVRSVEVDLAGGKALVTFVEGEIEPATVEQTIEKIGYDAALGEPTLSP